MPKMDDTGYSSLLQNLIDIDAQVKSGTTTWQDYFSNLKDNQKWQIDFVQNTDLQKASLDDVKIAQDKGRQAAITHNAALKQQTLGAKAAKFAMSALATVGNMIVFTLISEGISKLMNAETEALEKAQSSYEAAVEKVNKLNEREDKAISLAKELSELFSDENFGAESAKRASDIYDEMADMLEDVGGVEDDRIAQLRAEGKQIKENTELTKESIRKAREAALIAVGWGDASKTNAISDEARGAREVLWTTAENIFSDTWNLVDVDNDENPLFSEDVNVYKLDGITTNSPTTDYTNQMLEMLGDLFRWDGIFNDRGYIVLRGDDGTSEYEDLIRFMKAFEEIRRIPGISGANDPLYNALLELYSKLLPAYEDVNTHQGELPVQQVREKEFQYLVDNGFEFDSQESIDSFISYLKETYGSRVADIILEELEAMGFNFEEDFENDDGIDIGKIVPLSKLKNASENISALQKAFKDLTDDGYITVETLAKIQEATGLAGDEWERFYKRIMTAKKGSVELNTILSELIYNILMTEFGDESGRFTVSEDEISMLLRQFGIENYEEVAKFYKELNEELYEENSRVAEEINKAIQDTNSSENNAAARIALAKKYNIEIFGDDDNEEVQTVVNKLGIEVADWKYIYDGVEYDTLEEAIAAVPKEGVSLEEGISLKFESDIETMGKASTGISSLSSAFKELSKDGYITTKTLGDIKTATGLADDEWEEYQTKLLNAKAGSAEFNQVMSDLTYKILDATFKKEGLVDATEEEIAAVLRESD